MPEEEEEEWEEDEVEEIEVVVVIKCYIQFWNWMNFLALFNSDVLISLLMVQLWLKHVEECDIK
jgi:hypothetical protein